MQHCAYTVLAPCTTLAGNAIKDNLLFQGLPPGSLDIIIDSMHELTVAAGTDIIRQVLAGTSP